MPDTTPTMNPELVEKIKKYRWVLLGLGAVILAGEFAGLIISGIAALGALAAAGITAAVGVYYYPTALLRLANWRLKTLKAEAMKNPVETMQTIYTANMKTIAEKDQKIANFKGRLASFKDKIDEKAQRYPQDMKKFQDVINNVLQPILADQLKKQKAAKLAAKQYAEQIDRGNTIWQMALEMHGLQELAGDIAQDVYQKIMKEVAFDSITNSFNTAVAELSVAADTEPDFDTGQVGAGTVLAALPEGNTDTVPVFPTADSRQPVGVRRTSSGGSQ